MLGHGANFPAPHLLQVDIICVSPAKCQAAEIQPTLSTHEKMRFHNIASLFKHSLFKTSALL